MLGLGGEEKGQKKRKSNGKKKQKKKAKNEKKKNSLFLPFLFRYFLLVIVRLCVCVCVCVCVLCFSGVSEIERNWVNTVIYFFFFFGLFASFSMNNSCSSLPGFHLYLFLCLVGWGWAKGRKTIRCG